MEVKVRFRQGEDKTNVNNGIYVRISRGLWVKVRKSSVSQCQGQGRVRMEYRGKSEGEVDVDGRC